MCERKNREGRLLSHCSEAMRCCRINFVMRQQRIASLVAWIEVSGQPYFPRDQ
jgi:hypothetical protein